MHAQRKTDTCTQWVSMHRDRGVHVHNKRSTKYWGGMLHVCLTLSFDHVVNNLTDPFAVMHSLAMCCDNCTRFSHTKKLHPGHTCDCVAYTPAASQLGQFKKC